ncbi:MAG: branched-chain amino acid ABC transporter substrate-binding protein [Deltaproteobacteria bacterium]|nr:MAG: branched-chain amino acid ABC transporter substrate-binding protein [Deltaproteobacteria bacterium]
MPVGRILLAAAILIATSAAAAPVKIGIVNSMTGPEAPIGEDLSNGIKLAIEDLKKKNIEVQAIWEDDTGKPQVGISAMEKLATRDNVAGVVGAYTSAVTSVVAKTAERYKVPLVNPVASKEEITRQGYKYVFRVSATTNDYAQVLLDMALSFGQPKTLGILNENTDFGVSGGRSAKEYAEKKGLKVVFNEAYSKGSPDYRSTLVNVKNANPDIVFMVSYVADAILLMRQSREIALSPMAFLGAGAGFSNAQFAKETAVSNGIFSSTQWTSAVSWPGAKEFAKTYQERYGKPASYHAATDYTAMWILAQAASQSNGDREKTRAALDGGSWETLDGTVKFADYEGYTNQNKHQMLVEQIQNGKFVTVWPKELQSGKPIWPFPGWK